MKTLVFCIFTLTTVICVSQSQTGSTSPAKNPLPSIRSAEEYAGANASEKIEAADSDCHGSSCVIVIPSSLGPGQPRNPSPMTTFLDLRGKKFRSNPIHSGINITDGQVASDWLGINTGGLPRSKLYVGYTPPSTEYPGDLAALFLLNAASGRWQGGALSTADETLGCVMQTRANTDTLTNATLASPLAHVCEELNTSVIGTGLTLYDLKALTASIFAGSPTGQGSAGRAIVLDGQGLGGLPATGFHVGKAVSVYAEAPGLNVAKQNTYSGTVTVNGNIVTWVDGDKFYSNVLPTLPIVINGTTYVVASVQSPTQLTLGSSGGSQPRPVEYRVVGEQYSLLAEGNVKISPIHTTAPTADPHGGGGFVVDTESGGGPNTMMWIRDGSNLQRDGTYGRKAIRVGGSDQQLQILDATGRKVLFAVSDNGNVGIAGTLTKGGGSFKIDHPLDPANKYLYHSFVESPDMKDIYDGVAILDANGETEIRLPDWFQALNRDFRYQLTCIGASAPVYIAQEIQDNRFRIAGGSPGLKVSWQVTGIRQDAFANNHRIPVEEEKPMNERGHYLYPELFDAPKN